MKYTEVVVEVNDVILFRYNGSRERSNFVVTAGIRNMINDAFKRDKFMYSNGRPIVVEHVMRDSVAIYTDPCRQPEFTTEYTQDFVEPNNRCHDCARGRIRINERNIGKCDNPHCPSHKPADQNQVQEDESIYR